MSGLAAIRSQAREELKGVHPKKPSGVGLKSSDLKTNPETVAKAALKNLTMDQPEMAKGLLEARAKARISLNINLPKLEIEKQDIQSLYDASQAYVKTLEAFASSSDDKQKAAITKAIAYFKSHIPAVLQNKALIEEWTAEAAVLKS